MIWAELVRLTLLGGDRSHLPPKLKQQLEGYGIHTDAPFSETLLEGAALFNQIRKAASPLIIYKGELPSPIPETEGVACSPKSSTHLQAILQGKYAPALDEFISHLKANNKKIPPETLPDLFNESLQDKKLWKLLRPVIGQRGEWLLRQIREWETLIGAADLSKWESGTKEERLAILTFLRKQDPPKAILLLEKNWDNLAANDKYAFLKLLQENISKSDETFLEARLDDKHKKVRLEAARLLSNLSGSTLIDRLFVTLLNYVHINENSITFELPEILPETTVRDGIYPVPLKGMKGGMKAAWLRQITSRIPPNKWSELMDKTAAECLPFFTQGNWADHLLPALTTASLLHKNQDWSVAVLHYLHTNGNHFDIPVNVLKNIIQNLSAEVFAQLSEAFLQSAPRIIENKNIFYLLLTENHHPWTDKLTLGLIQNFKAWMRSTSDDFLSINHYREIFDTGAYTANPQLLEKLKIGWPNQSEVWYFWEDTIDKFIRTIAFRKQMIRELRK